MLAPPQVVPGNSRLAPFNVTALAQFTVPLKATKVLCNSVDPALENAPPFAAIAAVLLSKVLLVIVTTPPPSTLTAPPTALAAAAFAKKVLLRTDNWKLLVSMAPP